MIKQSSSNNYITHCYECQKLIIDDCAYCIVRMDKSSVSSFPNGDKHVIGFCIACWDLIAGKTYTFSQEE